MTMRSRLAAFGGNPWRLSAGRELLLVSALYLLLTGILTYPTMVQLGSHIPGSEDAPRMVWDIWAFSRAIIDPQTPLKTTDLICYPLPDVPTIWSSPGSLLISLPLAAILGPVLTYDLLFLSSFVLAGLFGYLLVRHLCGNKLASVAAGSMFSFSAYHFAHGAAGHYNLFSIQWLPFCALCLLRLFARPDPGRTVQSVVAATLVVWTFPYFGAYFLLPLLACFFLYYLYKERSRVLKPRFLAGVALALAVSGGGAFLLYSDLLLPSEDMATALQVTAQDIERYSADLLAFVVPSATHPLFGGVAAPVYVSFTAPENVAEMTVYVGFVALVLALWGLRSGRGADAPFWAMLALVALVLSLGPVLHVAGRALCPLPYALLAILPLFEGLRAPSRSGITLMLSVSVLAGYGLSDLLGRIPGRAMNKAIVVSVVLLMSSFESLPAFPYQSSSVGAPVFYEQVLDGLDGGALFELPSGPGHQQSTGWYMLYQISHHRKLVSGYLARDPLPVVLFPHWVLRGQLLSPPVTLLESDNWQAFEVGLGKLLAYNDIRYVVLHRQAGPYATPYDEDDYEEVRAFLRLALGEPVYEDEGLVAHEAPRQESSTRATFSGRLELLDHLLVESSYCPDGSLSCVFLVSFWQANSTLSEDYDLRVQLTEGGADRVVARVSHRLGYQFRLDGQRARYRTSWWAPGVVIADYTLLPSKDSDGEPLSGLLEIGVRVVQPATKTALTARSEYYTIDGRGRLLIGSFCP